LVFLATALRQTWDLDAIFEGGSGSPALAARLASMEAAFEDLLHQAEGLTAAETPAAVDRWCEVLERLQELGKQLSQAGSFIYCLTAQSVKDEPAKLLQGRVMQIDAVLEAAGNILDAKVLAVPDAAWQALLADPRIEPIAFPLGERRVRAKDRMDPARETLATDLSVDGYHGWGSLWETITGRITIPFEKDGKTEQLYVGQAANKFSEPDRAVRARLFTNWEEAWGKEADLIAGTLNHLSGFRLNLYRQRGWQSVLKEPLENNRMSEATLWAMWDAVSAAKGKLLEYLRRRARLLGYESINWYDLDAPLNQATRKVTYDEASSFIVDQFGRFSPRMARFAQNAFAKSWIEAEDRAGKMPGGFCTDFPESGESRIFMTFGGEPSSVSTLAHELGHAYHTDVMVDLPPLTQRYAMNVAETASTFAELITLNAAIEQAHSLDEKLSLLDEKLGNAVSYLMNIHSRFLFETAFYEARRAGPLSIEQLNDMMLKAQKEGYQNGLGVYHPLFWASKGHFYSTGAPFYNYPYTFGFLFSAGVYAHAVQEGPRFEQRYVDLLRDTGRTTVEDLAARHLGADLTRPDFWLTGAKVFLDDVDEFLRLTADR